MNKFPLSLEKIGKWWYKGNYLPLLGINQKNNAILFGICNWDSHPDIELLISEILEKKEQIQWNADARTEYYLIVTRVPLPEKIKEKHKNLLFFDLSKLFQYL